MTSSMRDGFVAPSRPARSCRGLARPVRAEHAVHLALADPHAEPVDRGEGAMGFREADRVDGQDIAHGGPS
jgi:hypothetical protein